jgi:hypothetical protein
MSIRKYENPDQRNIRQERDLFNFVSDCGFEHNSVYYLGAKALWSMFGETQILPAEQREKYFRLFENSDQLVLSESALEKLYKLLSERMNTLRDKQTSIENQPEEMIRVWDIGYSDYRMIPKSQFNPIVHKLVR